MTNPMQADVSELARRLADAKLVGFGPDGAALASAKVGFTKENPPPQGLSAKA